MKHTDYLIEKILSVTADIENAQNLLNSVALPAMYFEVNEIATDIGRTVGQMQEYRRNLILQFLAEIGATFEYSAIIHFLKK